MITANRASSIIYSFIKSVSAGTYILPANICPVVPLTFIKAKIPFEFIDINEHTLCINEKLVIKKLNSLGTSYAGVVFVRTYGYKYDTSKFFKQIKEIDNNIKIIDDRCLCFPDFNDLNENIDLELYSTGYAKPVDLGFGGFAKINPNININQFKEKVDPKAYKQLETDYKESFKKGTKLNNPVKNWLGTEDISISKKEYFITITNQLQKIKDQKQKINEIYTKNIKAQVLLPPPFNNWRFNIRTNNKEKILQDIFQAGLFASSHYQPANLLFENNQYPESEKLFNSVINLFNDRYMDKNKAKKICDIINNRI